MGLSQRQAAGDLGISQALLSHYENGVREPKLEFVIKACEYYGVTTDYVLGRSQDKNNDDKLILPCQTEDGYVFSDKMTEVFDRLDSIGDDKLRSAAAKYMSAAADRALVALTDPHRQYNPLSDAKMKTAEAEMFVEARRVSRGDSDDQPG